MKEIKRENTRLKNAPTDFTLGKVIDMIRPLANKGPSNNQHRNISEDIPIRTNLMAILTKNIGLKPTRLDAFINICSIINEAVSWKTKSTFAAEALTAVEPIILKIFPCTGFTVSRDVPR